MSDDSNDDRFATLREEIRRAGRHTRWWRLGVGGFFLIPAILALVGTVDLFLENLGTHSISELTAPDRTSKISIASLEVNGVMIAFLVAMACFAALLAAAIYRAVRRFRIRQRLATLHPYQIADVLLPLRDERGDTRKIVTPLLRQFHIPIELTAARPTDGRDDEPARA